MLILSGDIFLAQGFYFRNVLCLQVFELFDFFLLSLELLNLFADFEHFDLVHIFDRLALFFFVFVWLFHEAGVVFAEGENEVFVLLNFSAIRQVSFSHSADNHVPLLLFLVVQEGHFVNLFDFVVNDSFELVNDFLQFFSIVDVVEVHVQHRVV